MKTRRFSKSRKAASEPNRIRVRAIKRDPIDVDQLFRGALQLAETLHANGFTRQTADGKLELTMPLEEIPPEALIPPVELPKAAEPDPAAPDLSKASRLRQLQERHRLELQELMEEGEGDVSPSRSRSRRPKP